MSARWNAIPQMLQGIYAHHCVLTCGVSVKRHQQTAYGIAHTDTAYAPGVQVYVAANYHFEQMIYHIRSTYTVCFHYALPYSV